jgi:enterobactin synthetase component D
MYFSLMKPLTFCPMPDGFIKNVKYGSDQRVQLLSCTFDPADFRDDSFLLYGVAQPAVLQQAVAKRKAEFLAGRLLVKLALQRLTGKSGTLKLESRADRTPDWPLDLIGSISHTQGVAFCALAKKSDMNCIGLDVEWILPAETVHQLCAEIHNHNELMLMLQAGFSATEATSLIFSAKESLFKALYPAVQCFFGFEMARLISVDRQNHKLFFALNKTFAEHYQLKPHYKVGFCIKDRLVLSLLMQ